MRAVREVRASQFREIFAATLTCVFYLLRKDGLPPLPG